MKIIYSLKNKAKERDMKNQNLNLVLLWVALIFITLPLPGVMASTITYTYDDAGRLIKADYGEKSITYTYDNNGNILERRSSSGSIIKGDADESGIVDIVDALLTSMHSLSIQVEGNFNSEAADVDGVSGISTNDALKIAEKALGFQAF